MAGYGLRHGRSQGMDGYTGNQFEYPIDPANTNPIFTGDPVILNGGFIEEFSGGTPGNQTPSVPIMGVFMGWRDIASKAQIGGNNIPFSQFWSGGPTAAAEPVAMVAMPPHSRFWIKGRAGTTFNQTDVGSRFELFYEAGNPNTGQSSVSLGQAAPTTGVVQLHRLVDLPNNKWTADGGDEMIMEVSVVLQQGSASDAA